MPTKLDQLRQRTAIVADTADPGALRAWRPVDCTTNPSLMLRSLSGEGTATVLADLRGSDPSSEPRAAARRYAVLVARDALAEIPGLVSVEVDPRLSHDADATVAEAREILREADRLGVPKARLLIKIAATWHGIEATRTLQGEGIDCNVTLVFSVAQALAAAEAGAHTISPFVGRVTDWHRAHPGSRPSNAGDPGVELVLSVRAALEARQSRTLAMAASFRTVEQIESLAGCPKLTISPALLGELAGDLAPLSTQATLPSPPPGDVPGSADQLDAILEGDAMARDNLASGLARFVADAEQLEAALGADLREPAPVGR